MTHDSLIAARPHAAIRAIGGSMSPAEVAAVHSYITALEKGASTGGRRVSDSLRDAVDLIRAERERQVASEGWTPEHDDGHDDGALALAAAAYAIPPEHRDKEIWVPNTAGGQLTRSSVRRQTWPKYWGESAFKPSPDDRVRELVKAGALVVAEVERLQRGN